MSSDLSLFLEVIIGALTLAGSVLGLGKWIMARIEARIAKLERERKESEEANRTAAKANEDRCREDNANATARIRELEKRSHDEGRQDRDRLLTICEQNSKAMERIAEHLPDPTPARSHQTLPDLRPPTDNRR